MLVQPKEETIVSKKITSKRYGATAIVEQLRAANLLSTNNTVIAGNPGSGEELLYIALEKEIHMALAEPAVGSIVDGASRAQSKPAIAIAHGFVGFSGLQGDVFNAAQRQSPMLIIVGVADSQAHTGDTHMFADVEMAAKAARCKYVKNASDPTTLIRDLRDAIIEAMTPPYGPVTFIVGSDVVSTINNEKIIVPAIPNPEIAPPYSELEKLSNEITSANSVGILVGDGISRSNAHEEVVKLAELLGAQVWASMESEVNFPRHHPLFEGNLGHMYYSKGRELLSNLDYIIAIGTPLYQTVFNTCKEELVDNHVKVASINYSLSSTLKGHTDVTFPIIGHPKYIVSKLNEIVAKETNDEKKSAIKTFISLKRALKQKRWEKDAEKLLSEKGVTMAKFAYKLEERISKLKTRPIIFNEALVGANGLTNFICNVNQPGMYYDTSGGSLGEWAGAVGAAMLGKPTLSIIGDGGFHYALQVLWNAAQRQLPIGFIVANNAQYGLLNSNMDTTLDQLDINPQRIKDRSYYHLPGIDYVKIAEGYGVAGLRVDREDLFDEAINQLVDFQKPFLIDLVLNKD